MQTIVKKADEINDQDLKEACNLLLSDEIIGFPTETVYGLAANYRSERALHKLYELKQRPKNKSFILHISNIEQVKDVAIDVSDNYYRLAKHFFPGPLTILLKKNSHLSDLISPNEYVGIRMPSCSITLNLIDTLQMPFVGTSANISGEKNPISAQEVLNTFQDKIPLIIDGGKSLIQTPSTVVLIENENVKILREGAISLGQILEVL